MLVVNGLDVMFQTKTLNQWENLCFPEKKVCGRQLNGNQDGSLMK